MTTAIEKYTPQGLTPQSVSEAQTMAETLAKATIVPEAFRNKPSDVFMAISYGMEVGMSPVTALMGIAVIKGRPTLYAGTMVALVLASGKAKYFRCVSADSNSATYETHRHGDPEPCCKKFSQADAKAAGLAGGMYGKYPQQMLEARAKAWLARDVYPDVVHGMVSSEEMREIDGEPQGVDVSTFEAPPTDAEIVGDTEVKESKLDGLAAVDMILACGTMAELESVGKDLAPLKGEDREMALKTYKEHRATLTKTEAA